MKTYVVGTHYKDPAEALLMSTYNICFHGEIRKLRGTSFLSGAKLGQSTTKSDLLLINTYTGNQTEAHLWTQCYRATLHIKMSKCTCVYLKGLKQPV